MNPIHHLPNKWLPASVVPTDIDLEVGVMGKHDDVATLVFPVRKEKFQWVDAKTKKPVAIEPTHWRPWRVER
jgi:hypothetical protein